MSTSTGNRFLVWTLAIVFAFGQATTALAGTTGTLNGQVLQGSTNAPVPDARVTASSVSQTISTVTDASGHFVFVSLAPDTYSVSVVKDGFEPVSLSGVTVFADQQQTVSIVAHRALKVIASTTSRAANALVKSGTTADVYSVSAADQKAAATLGGGGGLNNAYSAIASVPGVFVPQGQKGEYQSIFVRGGNYTQVGYEFDGVPIQRAFDQYPGGSLSSLGSQELQVYTGTAPVNTDSTALAGFINQVIKTGTHPGFGDLSLGLGAPYFYHQAGVETGGASADRNVSYYVGFNGYNQNFVYEKNNQFSKVFGPPINELAANCGGPNPTGGCYASGNGPNGYEHGPIFFGSATNLASRDFVGNFHFGIPHRRDGGKDDIQLLYTADYVRTGFSNDLADLGAPFNHDLLTGTITNPDGSITPRCTTALLAANVPCSVFQGAGTGYVDRYVDKILYSGPLGAALGAGDVSNTQYVFFPGTPSQRAYSTAASPVFVPLAEQDSYQQNGAIVKLQYQHNMGSNAFLRLYGYTAYSDWLQYGVNSQNINSQLNNFGGISPDYKLGAHTSGVALNFTDQLNPKHLLNVNASYTTSNTFRYNNSAIALSGATNSASTNTVAFLVDSSNPIAGICYRSTGVGTTTVAVDCGSAASSRYINPQAPGQCAGPLGTLCTAHASDPTVTNVATYSCNGHPCEYFTAANGVNATYNTVTPKFSSISIQDSWKPTDRLLIALGLRYDDFKYVLPDTTGGPARAFWVNYYNNYFCYNATTQTTTQLPAGAAAGSCSTSLPGTTQVAFSATSPLINDYPELQPRLSGTYTINANNVLRFSAGKSAEPASAAFQQYNTLAPNIFAGTNQLFYALGFNSPRHIVYPEESFNYDLSWEHQINGSDASWKITPYLRTTKNELSTVLLDPKTNFVSSVNVGKKNVKGLEFIVRKGSLTRNGWYGQLSYTYTYAREKFTNLPNGKTIVDGLNVSAIMPYNRLTSFCSTNPSDPRCGVSALTPAGAPCYTAAGAPAPACGPGTVANPYWNNPVQNLFDPNGNYPVYNTLAGSRFTTGSNQSYIVPHVASLVLNYKHDRWNVTPTFQLQAGGEYGRPTQSIGVNPASCSKVLATPVAGDPRYPNGAAGGSPYNAASCKAFIVTPDFYTGVFDNYGQFKEPTVFAGNLSLTYDMSAKVTAHLDLVNIVTSCFGGSNVPWAQGGKVGCNYGSGGSYTGNFYNPGDVIDPYVKYPYNPNFGSVFQSTSGGQGNPFSAYFSLNVKL